MIIFRSDTTPLVLNVFVFHSMPSSCPMDDVHCLLVLNIFALLDCRCLWFSIRHHWVFAVCIFCNSSNLHTKLHRPCTCVFAPSTSVGTTVHYLTASLFASSTSDGTTVHYFLDCLVVFCTYYTFHQIFIATWCMFLLR